MSLPTFGYTVDRDFIRIIPHVLDYLHITDILDLLQTNKIVNNLVEERIAKSARWRSMEISEASCGDEMEKFWNDFLLLENPAVVENILFPSGTRATQCEYLSLHSIADLPGLAEKKYFQKILSRIKYLKINKFKLNLELFLKNLVSLRIGIPESVGDGPLCRVQLPNLKSLDIVGFPVIDVNETSRFNSWLLDLLGATGRNLQWLRMNCITIDGSSEGTEDGNVSSTSPTAEPVAKRSRTNSFSRTWDRRNIMFLEINYSKNSNKYISKKFTDMLIGCETFPKLQTVAIGSPTSDRVINCLSGCPNVMHLVLNNFVVFDLKIFMNFLKLNIKNLQILILKIHGQSKFHFDSFIHSIVLAANGNHALPPLERFEIEVVMDEETGIMKPPYHTVTAMASLRCRYPDNMYFRRHKYGISMGLMRPFCTEVSAPTNISAPIDLFEEEILKGVAETPSSDGQWNSASCEWNSIGQRMRAMYVEIFDEYVEKELKYGSTSYKEWMTMLNDSSSRESRRVPACDEKLSTGICDLSATMATLRE
jgi:hypothetical protein